jgi:chitinase
MVNALQIVQTPPPVPTPQSHPSLATLRIHAGGSGYVDPSGQTWSGDYGFSSSPTCQIGNAIANTDSPRLYQTCRWGNFTYGFQLPNGNYNLTLKFAEPVFGSVGQRVLNVAINGAMALSNFDIVANAGGLYLAVDKAIPVSVTAQLTVQFSQGPADFPRVNAIQISPQ